MSPKKSTISTLNALKTPNNTLVHDTKEVADNVGFNICKEHISLPASLTIFF